MTLNNQLLKKLFLLLAAWMLCADASARPPAWLATIAAAELPAEAQRTLVLIKRGGPFPYAKDGVVFGNYEGALPRRKRGYYHEYTVKTPRARNRGARRIISGGDPATSGEYYYTSDHYVTFMRIQE